MKTFAALIILHLTSLWAFSQTDIVARLELGKRDPKPDFYEYSPVDGGLVTLGPANRTSSRYLGLVKYDANFKEVWKQRVLEQNGRKNIDFVSVVGPNIFVFVSEFFPEEKVIKTYYYQYDLNGELVTDEEILSIYPNQKEQKVELQYVLSPNKRRLLCYKNLRNNREAEQVLYYLFDDQGNYVQSGEINTMYPDNRLRVRTVRVSNEGNVYLLTQFTQGNRVRDVDDMKYIIYRHDIRAQQSTELKIELGDKYISDLAFRLDREENIYVAGFYSNRGTDEIVGTLFQQIAPDGRILLNAAERFNEEFLRNYLSSSQIDRGRELKNFYLDSEDGIILRSDGGVLLIAEKFFVTYQSYRDIYGYWTDREVFHYEDVILTSVSSSGEIEWHAIIDKNQVAESPSSLSYFNAIGPSGAYIFYEYKPRKLPLNIYYHIVDITGEVTDRIPLVRDYRYGNEFYPRFSEQISNNEAIMVYFENRGRKLSVVKIRMNP